MLAIAASRFPSTNNQLRTSSNLRNQATIQDDRVVSQGLLNAIIVKVNDTWLDAYDSDCDDISSTKAVLMANLINHGSNVLSKIKPTLYDGSVISRQHDVILVTDEEETLILEEDRVKQELDEIKTINIKLEHSVAKLLSENKLLHKEIEHLKKIYKDQFDSIKKTRALSKEHCDSLIIQLNSKSIENANLKGQIQEKVFVSTTLQNELRRLKGLIYSTSTRGSNPTGNTKNNRISQSSSSNKTNKVEDQSRSIKSRKNKKNHVCKTECNAYVMQSMLNANSKPVCAICNECLFDANHDKCVLNFVQDANVHSKCKCTKSNKKQNIWKPTENRSQHINFVSKFLGPVRFGSDQIAKIMGYEDYQLANIIISQVYYAEGLGHNLFFVGQFCDSDLKVAFRKHTYHIRDLDGVDLLKGSRGSHLYTLPLENMMPDSPMRLLSMASKTKSWLWH
nr:integrase, catalytic region, zinc finger, CCHC-type, peptidase aspartic, catalytic [Tanacetum cinerariifolium]